MTKSVTDIHQFYTVSGGISSALELRHLLDGTIRKVRNATHLVKQRRPDSNSVMLGWGNKRNTEKAKVIADEVGIPYWRLEDGFISYLGHPSLGDRRFSLIIDRKGIYYDATGPSELEDLLNNPDWWTPELEKNARRLLTIIHQWHISKYNHEPQVDERQFGSLLTADNTNQKNCAKPVLVVDQTYGDCSVEYGLADSNSFKVMLESALAENRNAEIWVKIHPDVVLGSKKGYLSELVRELPYGGDRIRLITDKVNAQSLFRQVDKVYVVTSQLGFEALLYGKSVTCFGVPFYSNWGLTDDRVKCRRRIQKHSVESLFVAACLKYTRYIHPETLKSCALEEAIELIIQQKCYQKSAVNTLYAVDFSLWKRAFIHRFVGGEAKKVTYVGRLEQALNKFEPGDGLLIWGRKFEQSLVGLDKRYPVWRIEDGFIRSHGLGVELRRPSSLVIDRQGIYYDATRPSDLENILKQQAFSDSDRRQGHSLIEHMLSNRVSKYNLTSATVDIRQGAKLGQNVILVPGQVQSDASLQFGCVDIKTNEALLEAVRKANPDAWIVYKPHPDVVGGHRDGGFSLEEAKSIADRVITTGDIFAAIKQADEVHVLTSLTGFEALLQKKRVVTYGLPFYAGWGLTDDRHRCPRRNRTLMLEELVYGALARYPRYINWHTRRFSTVENTILDLTAARQAGQREVSPVSAWCGRTVRKAHFLLEAVSQR